MTLFQRERDCRRWRIWTSRAACFRTTCWSTGVQLSDADIELLADRRMALALCPRSNQLLRVGKAPVEKLRRAGVKLVLGTDGLSSNSSLSIWDEMGLLPIAGLTASWIR